MPVSKGEQYETKKGELPEGGSIDKDLVRFLVVKRRYRDWSDCCIVSIVFYSDRGRTKRIDVYIGHKFCHREMFDQSRSYQTRLRVVPLSLSPVERDAKETRKRKERPREILGARSTRKVCPFMAE